MTGQCNVHVEGVQTDHALLAPEYDRLGDAPQVTEGTSPEVHYQVLPPEAVSPTVVRPDYTKPENNSTIELGSVRKTWWKKKRWLFTLVAVILIVAVAVGVGIGVGVSTHNRNASPTESLSTESQSETTQYSILNDTALASVTSSNGDRRIFFQDNNGTIRQAVFQNGHWASPISYIVANGAKANTPLAATLSRDESVRSLELIVLYYIAENNSVVTQAFSGGSWYNPGEFFGGSTFEAKAGSRHLSASFITDSLSILVIFEGKDGSVNAQFVDPDFDQDGRVVSVWEDVSKNLTSTSPGAILSAPFTISTLELGGDAHQACLFRDASGADAGYRQLLAQYNVTTSSFERYTSYLDEIGSETAEADNADLFGIPSDVDIVLANIYNTTGVVIQRTGPYGMVVNNSRLSTFRTELGGPRTGPQTEFPYARLATTTPINSTTFYLYHQMNGTHIAEEAYDFTVGAWTTVYVEIATS